MNPKERTQYCEQLWNDAIQKTRHTSTEKETLSVWRLLWLSFGWEYAGAASFRAFWLLSLILQDAVTPLASMAIFGTYLVIHRGNFMSPSQAFTVLALFSVLVRTFSIASRGFLLCGEAIIAVCRLQKLLNMEKDDPIGLEKHEVSSNSLDKAVLLENCSFCWEQKKVMSNKGGGKVHIEVEKDIETDACDIRPDNFSSGLDHFEADLVLRNIVFSVRKGELVSIHGPVGSGKSSLLLGILGEMQCLTGRYFVQDSIAYVPQQPWILNDTVRRNIVFTSTFDPERYQETIAVCALEHDISLLARGDDTEIDPILFQGFVRFNLHPFAAYTDAKIYEALERVHLMERI